jgi:hypothetical protein
MPSVATLGGLAIVAKLGRSVGTGIRNRSVGKAYAELRRRQGRAFRNVEANGVREWVLEYFHLYGGEERDENFH